MNRISITCLLFLTTLFAISPLQAQSHKEKIDGVASVVGDYLILECRYQRDNPLPALGKAHGGQALCKPSYPG